MNQSLENTRWREPEQPEISYPASPPAEEETEGQRVVAVGPRLFHLLTHRKFLDLFPPPCFILLSLFFNQPLFLLRIWIFMKRHWCLGALWPQRAPGSVSGVPSTVLSHRCCHSLTTTVVKSHCLKVYTDHSPCRRPEGQRVRGNTLSVTSY